MPRKKTIEQIEFAKNVEHKMDAAGRLRPVRHMKHKEYKKRKDSGTATPVKVIRIDAALYEWITAHKGDMSITQFANKMVRKYIEQYDI